jgi:hypothetical protein
MGEWRAGCRKSHGGDQKWRRWVNTQRSQGRHGKIAVMLAMSEFSSANHNVAGAE